jgi:hypothetical protein
MNNRRQFLTRLVAGMPAALTGLAMAQTPPPPPAVKLEENDPVAIALGYKKDTKQVDPVKYPQHKPDQVCSGCALLVGAVKDGYAPCSAFGNKLVTENGWCAAYAKRPEPAK